jgi:two-component system cell cycle response regulator CpdR
VAALEEPLRVVTFLYVEDNDYLRESICSLIEHEHRAVEAVGSAEEALEAMARRAFDVLVTDVSLPGMSGTDLARHWLAADPARWVVLCSGYEFRHGLDALGPNVRSLPKSFELEQLEALLGEIEAAVRRTRDSA